MFKSFDVHENLNVKCKIITNIKLYIQIKAMKEPDSTSIIRYRHNSPKPILLLKHKFPLDSSI